MDIEEKTNSERMNRRKVGSRDASGAGSMGECMANGKKEE